MASDLPPDLESPPLASFTLFPKLPREVRLMIWERSPLPTRIIFLTSFHRNGRGAKPRGEELVANHAPCPILFTCWDAYNVLRKRYSLTFRHIRAGKGGAQVYFNYDNDVLCIQRSLSDAIRYLCKEDLGKLQNLGLYNCRELDNRNIAKSIARLGLSLRTLTLIVDDYIPYYEGKYTEQEASNLVLIDKALDIESSKTVEYDGIVPRELTPEMAKEATVIDPVIVDGWRQKRIELNGRHWDMPKIDYKVTICAAFKKELEGWAEDKKWREDTKSIMDKEWLEDSLSEEKHMATSSPTIRAGIDPEPHYFDKFKYQWDLEKVCDSRKIRGQLEYRVEWKHLLEKGTDSTWYQANKFTRARDLIGEFRNKYPDKPRPTMRRTAHNA